MRLVRLIDEADVKSMIRGRAYEDALIVGPAVLALLEGVTIADSGFDGDPEALFIEVPVGRTVLGVVGLVDVKFQRCRFQNVGIIGTAADISRFRSGFATAASDSPSNPQVEPGTLVDEAWRVE